MADTQEKTNIDTFYTVDNSQGNVTLEIFINAPGQTCNSKIQVNDVVKVDNHSGSLEEQPLDTNKNLAGKTLFISTTITNTSGHEAKAEVIIRLKGGESPCEDKLFKTHAIAETVNYTYTCDFF